MAIVAALHLHCTMHARSYTHVYGKLVKISINKKQKKKQKNKKPEKLRFAFARKTSLKKEQRARSYS